MNQWSPRPATIAVLFFSFCWLLGCNDNNPVDLDEALSPNDDALSDVVVSENFDFRTDRLTSVTGSFLSNTGKAIPRAILNINRIVDGKWERVATSITSADGVFQTVLSLPYSEQHIGISTSFPGIPDSTIWSIDGDVFDIELGGIPVRSASKGSQSLAMGGGAWDQQGVPDYLEAVGDEISPGLLATVNASLPERAPVPDNNPHYLSAGNADMHLDETADVWITFVHEGAGWKNALGFYSYPTNSPPTSASAISGKNLIFPNVSYAGSGGGLHSGDKVYLGRFSAGTSIGWYLVSNGWNARTAEVGSGNYTVYSNPEFNPEQSPSKRQHAVLLQDADRELVLVAFEDVNREARSDNDFNDAIFYVSATPYEAIASYNTSSATDPGKDPVLDADGDGVSNEQDAFPYEADKAFIEYDPGLGQNTTIIAEDLWPQKGDYDFNDIVVDYHSIFETSAQGTVSAMTIEFYVRAIGAGFKNGLGIQLPLSPSRVKSVSGQNLGAGYTQNNSNGVESGQNNAVIIAFENAYDVVQGQSGWFVNTQPEAPPVSGESVSIRIEFTSPVPKRKVTVGALDVFLISGGDRGREIHLPGWAPTSKANQSLIGSGDDASGSGLSYTTVNGLPWMMRVSSSFAYPRENAAITRAHLKFKDWAQSGGSQHNDWYQDKAGFRDNKLIY